MFEYMLQEFSISLCTRTSNYIPRLRIPPHDQFNTFCINFRTKIVKSAPQHVPLNGHRQLPPNDDACILLCFNMWIHHAMWCALMECRI